MQSIAITINGISLALHGGGGQIEVRVVAGRRTAAVAASRGTAPCDQEDANDEPERRTNGEAAA